MRDIEVGLNVDSKTGLSTFGFDEVNAAIRRGARVVAVEPGNTMMRKMGEDTETVTLRLTGFHVMVRVDESQADPHEPE